LGEGCALGEEAVAGVDRVGSDPLRGPDERLDVEVGAHRVAHLADLVGFVCLLPVEGTAVFGGIDRDGADAELVGRSERPDGDLPAVGNKNLFQHHASSLGR
jgi:hypothetical protein